MKSAVLVCIFILSFLGTGNGQTLKSDPPIIAPTEQQAAFKPIYESFLKAQTEFVTEADPIQKEFDKKIAEIRAEFESRVAKLKTKPAFDAARKHLQEFQYQAMADRKLSSLSYEPVITDKKELAYQLKNQ